MENGSERINKKESLVVKIIKLFFDLFICEWVHSQRKGPTRREYLTWDFTLEHFLFTWNVCNLSICFRESFFSANKPWEVGSRQTQRQEQHKKAYDCHDLWVPPLFPTPEKLEDITQKAINLIVTQWGLCQHVTRESGYFRVFDLILQEHLVYSDRIPVGFETNSFQHIVLLIHCSHSILLSFSCAHSQFTSDNIQCLKMPFFNPRNWLWKAWFQGKSLSLLNWNDPFSHSLNKLISFLSLFLLHHARFRDKLTSSSLLDFPACSTSCSAALYYAV